MATRHAEVAGEAEQLDALSQDLAVRCLPLLPHHQVHGCVPRGEGESKPRGSRFERGMAKGSESAAPLQTIALGIGGTCVQDLRQELSDMRGLRHVHEAAVESARVAAHEAKVAAFRRNRAARVIQRYWAALQAAKKKAKKGAKAGKGKKK